MPEYKPYAPRPVRFLGLAEPRGYRIKQYAITYGSAPFRDMDFAAGLRLAFEALPHPAVTAARPGVGFAVAHQGNGADYAVLGWWDNENELPLRVVVRPQTPGGAWRPARDGESVCVWDLEVIRFERQAYVETVLSGGMVEGYLQKRLADGVV
ncbi:MAG TPA: hypothetical protein VKD90_11145 [Gemmataceae bacterium]|nr:hypothetical protein [Gemmataceae bacterium]